MASPSGPLDIRLNKIPFRIHATRAQQGSMLDPHYKCTEVEQIRDHFATGTDPNYSDFPVSVESIIAQDDWSKGLSPTRLQVLPGTYWRSDGVDMRQPNQAIMGPSLNILAGVDRTGFQGPVKKFVDFAGGCYLIEGGRVHKWDGVSAWGGSTGVLTTPFSAAGNAFTDLSVFNNLLLACAKGTTVDQAMPTPAGAPLLGKTAAATNLPAGAYQAVFTWVDQYGGESQASPTPVALTLLAGDALLVNPNQAVTNPPPVGAVAVNFYLLSAPAGCTLGFWQQSGVSGTGTLTVKTSPNGTATPGSWTFDNAGAGGVGRIVNLSAGQNPKNWATSQWVDRLVTAGGQSNVVASNDALILTMKYAWSVIPAAASIWAVDSYCAYWWTTDGATWTQVDPRGQPTDAPKADLFTSVRFQAWKALQPNKIYSGTDPRTLSTWQSTATQIGDQSHKITSLQGFILDVAIGKEDGLWALDRAGNDYPILPELATQADPNNCKPMKQWRNGLLFRIKDGFYRYEGSRLESIGLDRYRASQGPGSPFVVVDLAPYTNEAIALLSLTAGAYTVAYFASLRSTPYWHWQVFGADFGAARAPTCLAILANAFGTGPVVFWGINELGGHWYTGYLRLPVGTDNPLDDTAYKYSGADGNGGSPAFVTTELAPLPDQDKTWTKLVTHVLPAGTVTPLNGVSLDYAVDGDIDTGTWTSLTGPQDQIYQKTLYQEWFFPKRVGVVGKSIQFRVTLSGVATTGTYVLKHLVIHYKHRAQARRRWEIEIICETKTAGSQYLDQRTGTAQVLELLALRDLAQPVPFDDRLGKTWQVFVEKVDYDLFEKRAGEDLDRWVAKLTLLEAIGTATPAVAPLEPV